MTLKGYRIELWAACRFYFNQGFIGDADDCFTREPDPPHIDAHLPRAFRFLDSYFFIFDFDQHFSIVQADFLVTI